jgi:hypothetical protein
MVANLACDASLPALPLVELEDCGAVLRA